MYRLPACLSIVAAMLLSASLMSTAPAADDKDDKGWVQLFNGKDLTGWKKYEGRGTWEVKDGILVGSGPASHLFSERGDYENFHFRIEAKINDKGNSGQYFRTQFGPGFPKGYEAQINSTGRDKVKTGSLYNFGAKATVTKILAPPDTWFTQEVIADGNHIIIKVKAETTGDFVTTVDLVDEKNTHTKGHFALQQHDPGSMVQFKKIEVKELPKSK